MLQPSGQGLRPLIVVQGVLLLMLAGAGQAWQSDSGYRFAPSQEDASSGSGWFPSGAVVQDPTMTVGPGGRPYKFRDLDEPPPQQGMVFRPDSSLGQLPKNWGDQGTWASDPVLRQGMIFRPLDENKAQVQEKKPAPEPYPTPYPTPIRRPIRRPIRHPIRRPIRHLTPIRGGGWAAILPSRLQCLTTTAG